MKVLKTSLRDTLYELFGDPLGKGVDATVWALSSNYVIKYVRMPLDDWKNLRIISRFPSDAPVARIYDMRLVSAARGDYDGTVVEGIIIQEKLPMTIDPYLRKTRMGIGSTPPTTLTVNEHDWLQTDPHLGNHTCGRWIDLTSLKSMHTRTYRRKMARIAA